MVNFGYGPGMKYWDERKKMTLAEELNEMVRRMKKDGTVKTVYASMSDDELAPYVEVDGLYKGVRIRKITHLTEEQADELVRRAEKIYLSIMTGTGHAKN